jgi:predicted ferric reductase
MEPFYDWMSMVNRLQYPLLYSLLLMTSVLGVAVVPLPANPTVASLSLYISATLGYVGIGLLLWMYILGTRGVASTIFNDYAKLAKIHGWLGKYGVLLIFLHPIFICLSYGESLLYIFLPQIGTQFEDSVTLGKISLYVLVVVWLTSAIIRGKIAYRPWKYLHYLAYIALPFALIHIPNIGSSFMGHFAPKVFFYSTVILLLAFTLLRLRIFLNFDKVMYTVKEHYELNRGVYVLQLLPKNTALRTKLGQYVYLKLGYISEDHPFSVLHNDSTTGTLTVAYRAYGRFTQELAKVRRGAEIFIGGPYGSFTQQIDTRPDRPIVFIAGGIGVTPFVQRLIDQSSSREQWLFYANKTPQSGVFIPYLKRALGERFIPAYSQVPLTIGGDAVPKYISVDVLHRHLHDLSRYDYYLCGPLQMTAALVGELTSSGVDPQVIYSEEFSF